MGIQIHLHSTPCSTDRCVKWVKNDMRRDKAWFISFEICIYFFSLHSFCNVWAQSERLRRHLARYSYDVTHMATRSHPRPLCIWFGCIRSHLQRIEQPFDPWATIADHIHASTEECHWTRRHAAGTCAWRRGDVWGVERIGSTGNSRNTQLCSTTGLLVIFWIRTQFNGGDRLTEVTAAKDIDLARYAFRSNKGISHETIVAYGPHSSLPHFRTFNQTDMEILDDNTVIVDSGGQYLEGTTAVTRTREFSIYEFEVYCLLWGDLKKKKIVFTYLCSVVHFGVPTAEQRKAYTNVLRGIIRLSTLTFPDNVKPSEIDALTRHVQCCLSQQLITLILTLYYVLWICRSPMWGSLQDYPQATGHGVGSYLSVEECILIKGPF